MSITENSDGRVSVIIPARNEEANIARAVRSVAAQEDAREILVIDDQSTDRTSEVVKELVVPAYGMSSVRVQLDATGYKYVQHKNKFGQDYTSATGDRY